MNLKLEELRKRLLEPVPAPSGPQATVYRRKSSEPQIVNPPSAAPRARDEATGPDGVQHAESNEPAAAGQPAPENLANAVLQYVEQAAHVNSGGESMDQSSQYQLAQAVAKVFEQTKTFQDRLVELTRMFEPVERIGQAAGRVFAPLKEFESQLDQLARSFEPMRAFQVQLAQLAQTFEPMKGLQQQLGQLSEAFTLQLGQLVKALDPAKDFQAQILKLAKAFEPAAQLQNEFTELVQTFRGPVAKGAVNGSAMAAQPAIQH